MNTVTLTDIEMCRPGIWNNVPVTREALQAAVDAWKETRAIRPPRVQIGHDLKQRMAKALLGEAYDPSIDGWPKLGTPTDLRIDEEGALRMNFADVPERLAGWVKQGIYPFRSAGLRRDFLVNGKRYPWFFDHAALLGEQAPAVPGMDAVSLADGDTRQDGWVMLSYDASVPLQTDKAGVADLAFDLGSPSGGVAVPDPETLAVMLATGLGLPPGDLTAIWASLEEELPNAAKRAVPSDQMAPQQFGGYGQMNTNQPTDENGQPLTPENGQPGQPGQNAPFGGQNGQLGQPANFADLQAELAAVREELATMKAQNAIHSLEQRKVAIAARVDADIAGRSLPDGLRDTLLDLAERDDPALYNAVLAHAQRVPVGERGSSEQHVNLAGADPEVQLVADLFGLTPERILAGS